MKVRIDLDLCSGHGRCYMICPEVFGEDEEGYPVVASGDVAPEFREAVKTAQNNCPERAIEVNDCGGVEN